MITITLPTWIAWLIVVLIALTCVQIVFDIWILRLRREGNDLKRRLLEAGKEDEG